MLHPIFGTVLRRPDLIADHFAGYAALAGQEFAEVKRDVIHRIIAAAVAAIAALLALVLIGVAIMLGGVSGFDWVLVIVPGVTIVIAAISAAVAVRPSHKHSFGEFKAQMNADLKAMRMAESDADGY